MNKLQKLLKKQWFTLVELIIVIAIIAVLAVAAFMMLTKWLWKSRDSRRLSDLWTIQKWLEVWYADSDMWNGQYPDISEQTGAVLLYSGTEDKMLAYQGIVNLEVSKLANLQKTPLDPSDKNEYTYSVTANRKKFQLLAMLEDGSEATAIVNQAYALDYKKRLAIVRGFELGILLEEGTNLPIQYGTMAGTGLNLAGTLGGYIAKVRDGEESVVWTGIRDLEIYTQEPVTTTTPTQTYSCQWTLVTANADITNNTGLTLDTDYQNTESGNSCYYTCKTNYSGPNCKIYTAPPLVTSTDCTDAGWIWVSDTQDVYIGTSQGDGFCISPRVWDFAWDTTWNGISWNGWWNYDDWNYGWWDSSPIDDGTYSVNSTGNPYPQYGQTRRLDSSTWYTCKLLWSSDTDFDTTDNIVWRMKWLATNKVNLKELQDIEWVQGATPPNSHPIPALYIADCIDGVKDLWTDMEYKHYPNEDLNETITYTQYNTDESSNTDTAALSNITYQNRQKYLTAWTQKSGSHLPSAMSYITSWYASASDSDWDNLTESSRWEYQVACEANLLTDANDDTDNERIWLSSIGDRTGSFWGRTARIVGNDGCGDQSHNFAGNRKGTRSARFVVR